MIEELNRRLDAISGYIDGVHQRAEDNTPESVPPYPNRYLRRKLVEEQIEQSLFSPNLKQLHESVPQKYVGPEFIRQLLEAENLEDDPVVDGPQKTKMYLDKTEMSSIQTLRYTEKAQHV
ncbi:hypothetical protein TVAG_436630 [Trichomonas vaginalis G3]|uniref:Uncharacterized protein n=1 Tax=Trichomonas vaginalis (strain ATCC PRA-98 / G3) TaxID=412133 RepID=A2DFB1_TRIV3|nr:hypothetical protein TVAGG3_0565630 [Trichomonas vaginalis G3]EAY20839.1 hypothetical protein TVAG_436630 [Trichomonas vaginalis G3]KAI5521553.1 hypothetical protein TVAGG3_0565630 [Trichomonas vaginalis G3]|eukprot:XP_001581825.1 hypothetical protein [Trichomonas vaginalis G3]